MISVIIPTFNEAAGIKKLLQYLKIYVQFCAGSKQYYFIFSCVLNTSGTVAGNPRMNKKPFALQCSNFDLGTNPAFAAVAGDEIE